MAVLSTFFLLEEAFSIVVIILFWLLDGYYVQQERKIRVIYDWVVNEKEIKLFTVPLNKVKKESTNYANSFFSKSLSLFYFILIFICLVIHFFPFDLGII